MKRGIADFMTFLGVLLVLYIFILFWPALSQISAGVAAGITNQFVSSYVLVLVPLFALITIILLFGLWFRVSI